MANSHSKKQLYHDHRQHVKQVCSISLPIILALFTFIRFYIDASTKSGRIFLVLFFFRYIKLVVNTVSWILAKPYRPAVRSIYTPKDVTVVIPSANPTGQDFRNTVESGLRSGAAKLIIVTFGQHNMSNAYSICQGLDGAKERLIILDNGVANKRKQISLGVSRVETAITVFCDDHVFWPEGFLQSILSPFEGLRMGGVGMHKRVHRVEHKRSSLSGLLHDFTNFLACVYLDRHNMEILATSRLDGGVFIISGRTAAYRTEILKDPRFDEGFTNETFQHFWTKERIGPLNADDDNYIMRWLVTHDWKMWIQNGPEALMETTINNPWPVFKQQLLRWVRTTWRSNPRSLLEGKVVHKQPWSLYATYISLFVNFAAIWDPMLLLVLSVATWDLPCHRCGLSIMVTWILCSKLVKLSPHLYRHPRDIFFIPGYWAFAYYHSWMKFTALLTINNIEWGSRKNVDQAVKAR